MRNRNLSLILLDAVLVAAAYVLAFLLHFAFDIPQAFLESFTVPVLGVVILKLTVFTLFRFYKVIWRHIGMIDLFNVVKANGVCSVSLMGGLLLTNQATKDLAPIVVVDGLLSLFLVAGVRILIRLTALAKDKKRDFESRQSIETKKRKIVIVGAGEVGEKIFREIRDNGRLRYEVVGFLDDDPKKLGLNIHGKSVLGDVDRLGEIADKAGLDEVIIAIGVVSGKQIRRIVERCERYGLPSRTIPAVGDILNGQVSVSRLRPVAYEDLLGRSPVALDKKLMETFLHGKTILVTGGGGSIGSGLCREISHFRSPHLVICDNTENNLYQIEIELRQTFPDISIHSILADVRNYTQIRRIFQRFKPDIVIHAAAYKHVPLMELHPEEAVRNNLAGTLNMLVLAAEEGSERFVLVSTDKAVRPYSVMGATKRVAELLTVGFSARPTQTSFMIVRFGNVAGSEGSVIPLFKRQIEHGGPVTVTHPDITRYFMTLPETAQLILQACAMGQGGEIFVLDMGKPIKIVDVARDLIRLSGLEPEEDIEIKFTGLRPGEKLHEELLTEGEEILRTSHEKIMIIRGRVCSLDRLMPRVNELIGSADSCSADTIRQKLREIVPEYNPYGGDASFRQGVQA